MKSNDRSIHDAAVRDVENEQLEQNEADRRTIRGRSRRFPLGKRGAGSETDTVTGISSAGFTWSSDFDDISAPQAIISRHWVC